MKRLTLLFFSMFLFVAMTFAQVKEGAASMSKGSNNAFSLELRNTQEKEVQKEWEKFLKGYKGKVKFDKKKGETFADDSEIEEMSSNTVDVYSTLRQNGENTVLTVWFDLGGAFLNSSMHGEKVPVAKKMLNEFALSVSRASVEEDLKEQEKVLKDMEKDLKKLEKDKENLENDIKKYEEKIAQAKEDIKQNLEDQKNKAVEIKEQEVKVKEIEQVLKKLD